METKFIKCVVTFGPHLTHRVLVIKTPEAEKELDLEVEGVLGYMPEFTTTRGETLGGNQIVRICGKGGFYEGNPD